MPQALRRSTQNFTQNKGNVAMQLEPRLRPDVKDGVSAPERR
jgi:hypothetical protein